MRIILKISLLLLCLNLSQAFGQQHQSTSDQSHDTREEGEGSHFHRNHLAFFSGVTSELEAEKTHFTLGADYVNRPFSTKHWGIGVFGEAIMASHTEWLLGITCNYYFEENIWLRTGPGIEMVKVEGGHGDHDSETHKEFLYRIGLGYDFDVAGFTMAPSLDVDFVGGESFLVLGLNIGKGF